MSSHHCVPNASVDAWKAAIIALLCDVKAQLEQAESGADRVHALRRDAKQLRALSLLDPASPNSLAMDTRTHADTLRRSLGHARDATVRRETLDRLFAPADDSAASLRAALATSTGDIFPPSGPNSLHGDFATLADRWSEIDRRNVTRDALVGAVKKTYERARKRAKAARNGDSRKMHRWRRAIVDLNLQVGVFADVAPHLTHIANRAHKLRDLLGRIHDIDALKAFLAHSSDVDPHSLAAFRKAADRERERLEGKIKRRAKPFFKQKPGKWRDELAASLYAAERM